jgi:death-on-curing protein
MNHPFVDGNKRIGHAAMDAFLMLNGFEIQASVDDAEAEILAVASGERTRHEFLTWVEQRIVPLQ